MQVTFTAVGAAVSVPAAVKIAAGGGRRGALKRRWMLAPVLEQGLGVRQHGRGRGKKGHGAARGGADAEEHRGRADGGSVDLVVDEGREDHGDRLEHANRGEDPRLIFGAVRGADEGERERDINPLSRNPYTNRLRRKVEGGGFTFGCGWLK